MKSTEELKFEKLDIEIFKIPDTRTRLNTLQNYFFPRLEILLKTCLDLTNKIYGVNPYEKYSFRYRPSHRKDASKNIDSNEVHVGVSGHRTKGNKLKIFNSKGENYTFHPSFLTINVFPEGKMQVQFRPYIYSADKSYIKLIKKTLKEHLKDLYPALFLAHLSYSGADSLISLEETLTINFSSDSYYTKSEAKCRILVG